MPELSQPTQKLIKSYQLWHRSLRPKDEISTIHVDEVASRVASLYEKIRGVMEYKEEHLLRKTAVERKLKRRLMLQKEGETIAEPLLLELIRGGHLPNDVIEEAKIKEVQKIIDKYNYIIENSPPLQEKARLRLYNWILNIAACEIEETLSPPIRENALINYMFEEIREGLILKNGVTADEKTIETQLYIAIQRALFRLDSPLISYHLLKRWLPDWSDLPPHRLEQIAKKIYLIWAKIEKTLRHPMSDKFYEVCERYDTPFLLLYDILSEDPTGAEEKISNPETLESLIKKSYNQKVKTLKSRLGRAAIYATVSIFLTNIFVLFALEIPFTKYVMGHLYPTAIIVDILGPTLLMFLLIITVRPPEKGNLEQVIIKTVKIVYKSEKKESYQIKPLIKKRGIFSKIFIGAAYLISAVISFGLITWGLYYIKFPPLSYLIFIMFVALIAFAGVKIRGRANELIIAPRKTSFFGFLLDSLSLPILRTGQWLSKRWEKYNVMAVLFGALIDMPFQVFVEFFEQWQFFLKEKKEEIH